MMGKALTDLGQYAKKTDSGLLFLTEKEANLEAPTNCINCGRCANQCEIICVYRENELIDAWGNKCENGAVRTAR